VMAIPPRLVVGARRGCAGFGEVGAGFGWVVPCGGLAVVLGGGAWAGLAVLGA
jgi:hypothetical protein